MHPGQLRATPPVGVPTRFAASGYPPVIHHLAILHSIAKWNRMGSSGMKWEDLVAN